MKLFIFILLSLLILSCSTIDVEKSIKADSGIKSRRADGSVSNMLALPDSLFEPDEPKIIIVERPVFVPEAQAPPARTPAGVASVQESNRAGIIRPQDYSHAAMIYSYHPDFVYEVFAQPLRVSDISLQPGEVIVEPPFISDSERWILGAGVSYEDGIPVQHIYVKPSASGLSASLIINTDRRVYRIILRSFNETFMPIVRWRYSPSLPNNFIQPQRSSSANTDTNIAVDSTGINPGFLSFNYRITYGLFRRPNWLPRLVFDDGSKTYISFPELILHRELPVVFENRNDIINYRVIGNIMVIDKLIENLTVRIGRNEITITKKRGT